MVESTLKKLGLSNNEVSIYLSLLPLGQSPASTLAYRTKLDRGTARYTCKQLVKKGIVAEMGKGNTFIYSPEPPERILHLLSERQKEIDQKRDQANRILGDLHAIMNPNTVLPKVKFYQGKEGYREFAERSLKCKSKEILFCTSMENFRSILTEKYDRENYIPTRLENDIHLRLITPRTKLTQKMKEVDFDVKRETRFFPNQFNIANTLFIFDDVTTLISNEGHPSCVMITSEEITNMMKMIFEFMWSNAETD